MFVVRCSCAAGTAGYKASLLRLALLFVTLTRRRLVRRRRREARPRLVRRFRHRTILACTVRLYLTSKHDWRYLPPQYNTIIC